ncbi:MAG: hypothetical protein JKY49_17680 [Cohaesibacteraceae bacterium]|nr:hypothetical protein [Cohaesibacteraceae bacterium]
MTYIIVPGVVEGERHFAQIDKLEPDMALTPWLSSILMTGRSMFDRPHERTKIEGKILEEMPLRIFLSNYPKSGVPDILDFGYGWMVSKRVQTKLQDLEPSAHEFYPVDVMHNKTGDTICVSYLLNLHQKPDIIDHCKTLYLDELGKDQGFGIEAACRSRFEFYRTTNKSDKSDTFDQLLVNFKKDGKNGRHLWRGTVGDGSLFEKDVSDKYSNRDVYDDPLCHNIFSSDEFAEFIFTNDITGWIPVKILEETPEWYAQQLSDGRRS